MTWRAITGRPSVAVVVEIMVNDGTEQDPDQLRADRENGESGGKSGGIHIPGASAGRCRLSVSTPVLKAPPAISA